MRLFRRDNKNKTTGSSKKVPKWYIEFRDHNQTVRRLATFRDKVMAYQFGRRVARLIEYRTNGERLDTDMMRWLETIPAPLRDRLAGYDLLDSRSIAATRELMDHLADFKRSLETKGTSAKQAQQVYNRVKRVFDGCRFTSWSDISGNAIQTYLHGLRQDTEDRKGMSAQTYNAYLQSLKQFCKWMVMERRASGSPIEHLTGQNVRADRRHVRRPLTLDESHRLLLTTTDEPTRFGMTGPERSMLYRLALDTGLRANELRSLTRVSFDLDSDRPTVTVAAAYSKRRREDRQPMRAELAEASRCYLATKAPAAPAFSMPRKENVSKMIRADFAAARITRLDEAGRVVDFHALRHTFITSLAQSGVHPKTAQALARHSTIKLTMDRYSHSFREDEEAAVEALPSLSATAERQAATGTDDTKTPPEKLGVSLGVAGTISCDSRRPDETIDPQKRHGDAHEKTLKTPGKTGVFRAKAERAGFEPAVPAKPVRRFSKPLPSATRPPLQRGTQARRDIARAPRRCGGIVASVGWGSRHCPDPLLPHSNTPTPSMLYRGGPQISDSRLRWTGPQRLHVA